MIYARSLTSRENLESLPEGSEATFVIAGLGKFGCLALERLQNSFPKCRIIVLERDTAKCECETSPPVSVIQGDAVSLLRDTSIFNAQDIVIPMVPFNLAASYVVAGHEEAHEIAMPEEMLVLIPNSVQINASNAVCSRADFICPDDCPEGELCTVTGEPREPLYEALQVLKLPGYNVLVQKSSQILPGVGGYRLGDLRALFNLTDKGRFIVATACNCHGILTAIMR